MDDPESNVSLVSRSYQKKTVPGVTSTTQLELEPTHSMISSGSHINKWKVSTTECRSDDGVLQLQLPFSPEYVCMMQKSIKKVLTWQICSPSSDQEHEQIRDDDASSEEDGTMLGVDPDDISGSLDNDIISEVARSPECQRALINLANMLPQRFCYPGLNTMASIVSATVDYIKFLQIERGIKQEMPPTPSSASISTEDVRDDITPVNSNSSGEQVKRFGRAAGEPRRPKNGFIRFSVEHRKKISTDHPKLDNREISRMLGTKWRNMDAEERKPYEEEFRMDMRCIKEKFPDWKYAPVKRGLQEFVEPIPTRLRDRRYLKRKIPPLSEILGKKTNKPCKNRRVSNTDGHLWIKCFVCNKWRILSPIVDQGSIPDKWYCAMNPDFRHNSCDVPEELNIVYSPEDDDMELYCFSLND